MFLRVCRDRDGERGYKKRVTRHISEIHSTESMKMLYNTLIFLLVITSLFPDCSDDLKIESKSLS